MTITITEMTPEQIHRVSQEAIIAAAPDWRRIMSGVESASNARGVLMAAVQEHVLHAYPMPRSEQNLRDINILLAYTEQRMSHNDIKTVRDLLDEVIPETRASRINWDERPVTWRESLDRTLARLDQGARAVGSFFQIREASASGVSASGREEAQAFLTRAQDYAERNDNGLERVFVAMPIVHPELSEQEIASITMLRRISTTPVTADMLTTIQADIQAEEPLLVRLQQELERATFETGRLGDDGNVMRTTVVDVDEMDGPATRAACVAAREMLARNQIELRDPSDDMELYIALRGFNEQRSRS